MIKKVHHKGRPKGKNEKEKFTKDESHSEPEEVEREKSKRRKKTICNKEVSVKGYGDQDHYSDSEVCEKSRSKEHLKRCEVNTESESELSSDEKEMEKSSFEDDTSHNKSGKRKSVTRHSDPQKDYRNKRDAKSCNMQYSDEGESTKVTQKSESEEESSSASSSDEEETEVRKHTKNSKHTQTKSATRAKDTTHYESEEKGKTSGKKGISLEPKSATAKASVYPEEYQDKGRKKAVIVDEKVGKSTDSSQETYHKTSSKPGRKEGDRKIVSGKKATAPSLKRNLPSSEMTQTDSGDGESDKSSEGGEQKSSDEEEQTENEDHSPAEEKEEKRTRKSKEMAIPLTTKIIRLQKPKNHDDENHRRRSRVKLQVHHQWRQG